MTEKILVASMPKDNQFYLEGHESFYRGSHLVTAENHNEALGIEHIHLVPTESEKAKASLFQVIINMQFGIVIRGSIWPAEGGGLRLGITQEKSGTGESARYYDIVEVPTAVRAQVLRYASRFVVEREIPQVQTYGNAPTNHYAPPAPSAGTAPATGSTVDANNVLAEFAKNNNLTQEQVMALYQAQNTFPTM